MPYLDVKNDMGIDALAADSGVGKYGRIIYLGEADPPDWLGHHTRRLGVGTPLQIRIVCETTVTSSHASDTFRMALRTDTHPEMDSLGDVHVGGATIGTEPDTLATEIEIEVANTATTDHVILQKGSLVTFDGVSGIYTITEDVTIARDGTGTINIDPGIPEGTWTGNDLELHKGGFIRDLWTWEGELSAGDEILVPMPLDQISEYLAIWYNPQVLATETFSAGKIKAFIEPHLG